MIHQISTIKTKTEPLPTLNKGLLQVRHIQSRLHETSLQNEAQKPEVGELWSPLTAGPYIVPILRWIE